MIIETSKKILYAAVGAPVVTARRFTERITDVSGKVHDLRDRMNEELTKELDAWAAEGEKLIERIREREGVEELVDDLAGRVDLDQIQEQVGKLREHLDDILQSWRNSFRPTPTTPQRIEVVEEPSPKPAAAKKTTTAAKKPAAKTTPAKKPAAKKTTTAAKKPAAKTTTAKKPAAKKTTTAAKKPAAKTTTTAA
ncbi:hypothetical protein BMS3Abin02_02376 [bacterium BMS3Abin02]|nr:hypothetical protein BMS3Abin02_02376 [bacterium BMS3Abin02]